MPPKFTSRQLAYDAPPVPSFLQKLHSQVNQGRGNINDKRSGSRREETSEFDNLLGIGSSSSNKEGEESRAKEEEEDEFDGAQIVVLKEGKHLSKEEASKIGKLEQDQAAQKDQGQGVIAGPQAAPSSSSTAKRKQGSSTTETQSSGLDNVKNLINSSKQGHNNQDESEEEVSNLKRKDEKEKAKAEKNKRARIEKSKRGKGLSFDMED